MDQPHQDQGQPNGADHYPLSCAQIAKLLKRNSVSISRAIKRLGLKASVNPDGHFKFYDEAAVAALAKGMRKKNGSAQVTLTEVAPVP